jgi:MFS family permease
MAARSLRSRNYRLFFIGQCISLIGTWMQQTAISWVMFQQTASTWLLGLVVFCALVPTLLLAPLAGALADRVSRLRILWVTQSLALVQASVLAWLTWTGRFPVGVILGLELWLGIINAFDMPTRQALVPALVDRPEDVPNAIALNSSIFNLARLIGPMLAGSLLAWLGAPLCFAVNAVSYVAVLLAFALMSLPPLPTTLVRPPLFSQLQAGVRYVQRMMPIRETILLLAVMSFCSQSYAVLTPVFATQVLHGNAFTLGSLTGAIGLGALTGALYLARRPTVLGLGRVMLVAGTLFGLAVIGFAWSRLLWLSLLLLIACGLGMMIVMAGCNTIVQTLVDEAYRGRVMSLYTMAFAGAMPLGGLAFGTVAGHLGAAWTVTLGGLGTLVATLWFARRLPHLRQAAAPIYRRKGILPPEEAA